MLMLQFKAHPIPSSRYFFHNNQKVIHFYLSGLCMVKDKGPIKDFDGDRAGTAGLSQ